MEKQPDKIPVVAVVGPTASGKTGLAVSIARQFGGEVISADSMQVYRGMDVATAKPSEEEKQGIPHHLMDCLDPGAPFSVADYAALAHKAIADVFARGKLPLLVGGTGLYVGAVLDDLRFTESKSDPALREKWSRFAEEKGGEALLAELQKLDPETAARLHPNDRGRIIRAIEVCCLTGIPMSEQQRRSRGESRYRSLKIGLNYRDRQALYDRIDRRVDQMLEQGLLAEAREAIQTDGPTALQAIGCKEFGSYFAGISTLEEAVESVKRESRRYAKRQLTWFRRDPEIRWFYPDETDGETLRKNIFENIDNFLHM